MLHPPPWTSAARLTLRVKTSWLSSTTGCYRTQPRTAKAVGTEGGQNGSAKGLHAHGFGCCRPRTRRRRERRVVEFMDTHAHAVAPSAQQMQVDIIHTYVYSICRRGMEDRGSGLRGPASPPDAR